MKTSLFKMSKLSEKCILPCKSNNQLKPSRHRYFNAFCKWGKTSYKVFYLQSKTEDFFSLTRNTTIWNIPYSWIKTFLWNDIGRVYKYIMIRLQRDFHTGSLNGVFWENIIFKSSHPKTVDVKIHYLKEKLYVN